MINGEFFTEYFTKQYNEFFEKIYEFEKSIYQNKSEDKEYNKHNNCLIPVSQYVYTDY